jgi:hypothetical protein
MNSDSDSSLNYEHRLGRWDFGYEKEGVEHNCGYNSPTRDLFLPHPRNGYFYSISSKKFC